MWVNRLIAAKVVKNFQYQQKIMRFLYIFDENRLIGNVYFSGEDTPYLH